MSDNVGSDIVDLIPGPIERVVNEDGSITETRSIRAISLIEKPTYEKEQETREKEDVWCKDSWRKWDERRKAEHLGLVDCFHDMDPEWKSYQKGGAAKYKQVLEALRKPALKATLAKRELGTEWYCPMKAGDGVVEMQEKEAKRDKVVAEYGRAVEWIIEWLEKQDLRI